MLWCKATFEQQFDAEECRLFPAQQQLFDFVDAERNGNGRGDGADVDAAAAAAQDTRWLCFSIEFPSASDVARLLSRHARTPLFRQREQSHDAAGAPRKRVRDDFALLYGATPLAQQTRMFLAATVEGLRCLLSRIEARQLHLYEILRDGAPCHLYFDVERDTNHVALHHTVSVDDDDNSGSSSGCSTSSSVAEVDALVRVDEGSGSSRRTTFQCSRSRYEQLRRCACHEPEDVCGLDCCVEPDNRHTCDALLGALERFVRARYPSWLPPVDNAGAAASAFAEVLVLESAPLSGTATKFSQHYVLKLHERMFRSTSSVKVFVRDFVAHLSARAACDAPLHRALFFHGTPVWLPVYRELPRHHLRNTLPYLPRRCVVDEAVYSKNRMMRCVGSCKLGKESVLRLHRHLVRGAVVHHASDTAPSLELLLRTLIAHPTEHAAAPVSLIDLAQDADAPSTAHGVRGVAPRTMAASVPTVPDNAVLGMEVAELASRLEAAYSRVACCACTVAARPHSVHGQFLAFAVRGTRYCQNVGREHKSNNVYLVVDTVRRTFVQKCFDPDCASYRSPSRPLDDVPPDAVLTTQRVPLP
ncbi:PrimPol-like protein 1 [Novymonas esmeraldas]|uniref:DNA-directed primase/polymerase protein n=1 Tax=Novymonas esmeraldas TaxID=1808958 RepID=A0AAW0EUT9_9TRYP